MKQLTHGILLAVCVFTQSLWAQDTNSTTTTTTTDQNAASGGDSTSLLISNWGAYEGLDLNNPPDPAVSISLIDPINEPSLQMYAFISQLGATPVNGFLPNMVPTTLPSTASSESYLNSFANILYSSSGGSSTTSVPYMIANIDQPSTSSTQNDPTSQLILNTIATASTDYCGSINGPGSSTAAKGTFIAKATNSKATGYCADNVTQALIGPPPPTATAFNAQGLSTTVSQLNGNILTGPLLYSSTADNPSTTTPQEGQAGALTATSQIEQANDFIRFSLAGASPLTLPKYTTYDQYYSAWLSNNDPTLQNYLKTIYGYAARLSVPIANMYFIFNKRMPQPSAAKLQSGDTSVDASGLSQALAEFQMATWRIYNPAQGTTPGTTTSQWPTMINQATDKTVQKEIALLLSEINYQLYLNRQIQERQLLTESLMLVQNLTMNQPDAGLNNSGSTALPTSSP